MEKDLTPFQKEFVTTMVYTKMDQDTEMARERENGDRVIFDNEGNGTGFENANSSIMEKFENFNSLKKRGKKDFNSEIKHKVKNLKF